MYLLKNLPITMIIIKLNTLLLDETIMLQIDFLTCMGNQGSTFVFFCLKDLKLLQFLFVPETSGSIFEAI